MASRRHYLTNAELEEYADIAISDETEADDRISQAEELIDSYVGAQIKAVGSKFVGQATDGTTTTIIDTSDDSPFTYNKNYFNYCEVEIVAGTNVGETRSIISSDPDAKSVTVNSAFTSAVDDTTVYRIRQIGKFPRYSDSFSNVDDSGVATYYKTIPDAVKRAVAAQMEYMIEKGEEFFSGSVDDISESIGDYSHTMGKGINRNIAPKSRLLLKGIINKKGELLI